MRGLFDTHILLDYLRGEQKAADALESYQAPLVSVMSVAELSLAANDGTQSSQLKEFFGNFEIVPIDSHVVDSAVHLRKQYRKLPMVHACLWASAKLQCAMLVTRNSKDFPIGAVSDIAAPY